MMMMMMMIRDDGNDDASTMDDMDTNGRCIPVPESTFGPGRKAPNLHMIERISIVS